MLDILLVNPPQPKPDKLLMEFGPSSPPLGLCYIAGALARTELSFNGFDFDQKDSNINTYLELIRNKKPKIIGITTLTNTYITALTVAELSKNVLPDTLVVFGGEHPSFCYESVLENNSIDFVVLGEGDISFPELAEALIRGKDYQNIKGIAYKINNELKINESDGIIDLELLSFPDRDLFDLSKYYDPISIITSRGCSANCIFCSASAFRNAKVSFRSASNVLMEVEQLYKRGFEVVNFVDDNFLLKKQRAVEIISGIKENFPNLFWTCSARADFVDKDLIKLLTSSGCKGIHFGVETVNKESQKAIKKYLSIEKLESALKTAKNFGLRTYCSFILGLPFENYEIVWKNVQYAVELNKKFNTSIVFGVLTPFPGTQILKEKEYFGIEILSHNYSDYDISTPVINSTYLTQEQLRELLFNAQKLYLENLCSDTLLQIEQFSSFIKNYK